MKDRKMSIRISEKDLQKIRQKAKQSGLTFTDYVTRTCLKKKIIVIDGLDEVIRLQKAIGNNLNQLTKLANLGRIEVVDLQPLKEEYSRCTSYLSGLLEGKE